MVISFKMVSNVIPGITLASIERTKWDIIPRDLIGIVVDSIEELQRLLPEDNISGGIYLRMREGGIKFADRIDLGFDRYSRDDKLFGSGHGDVAYGCPKCEKIIIGPPRIEGNTGKGVSCYCTNCGANILSKTLIHS